MKPTKEVTNCEFCDRLIELISPPYREAYVNGQIEIKDGIVLLDRPKDATSHAAFLTGFYCGPACLASHIRKLRSPKE
jgi:hypothetical protein